MKHTPYQDINKLLNLFLLKLKHILTKKLISVYLYGSLASGDFDYESSDIDFVVVVTDEVDKTEFEKLKLMHTSLKSSKLGWG